MLFKIITNAELTQLWHNISIFVEIECIYNNDNNNQIQLQYILKLTMNRIDKKLYRLEQSLTTTDIVGVLLIEWCNINEPFTITNYKNVL